MDRTNPIVQGGLLSVEYCPSGNKAGPTRRNGRLCGVLVSANHTAIQTIGVMRLNQARLLILTNSIPIYRIYTKITYTPNKLTNAVLYRIIKSTHFIDLILKRSKESKKIYWIGFFIGIIKKTLNINRIKIETNLFNILFN